MTLNYILRLDDACPTDRKEVWSFIERALDDQGIKPIIAVIPKCKDKDMLIRQKDEYFWERIRRYQAKGYTIALHGHEHDLVFRHKGLVPLNSVSEFAGMPFDLQRDKIRKGFSELVQNGIHPTIWVAPAHTFDKNTLLALKAETDIKIISDGIAFYPFVEDGFIWIPQQLWNVKKMPFGVWTICLHPNSMDIRSCEVFLNKIEPYLRLFASVDEILENGHYQNRGKNILEYFFEKAFLLRREIKRVK